MATFSDLIEPAPRLRRSVIDDLTGAPVVDTAPTGDVVTRGQVLPLGRTDAGNLTLAVPGALLEALGAAQFPGQVLRGEKGVFDPATGHVSQEAMDAANGIAALAMTGSMPVKVPRGALRSFGGAAEHADDPFAALEAALVQHLPEAPKAGAELKIAPSTSDAPTFLDPAAKQWDVFHGSTAGPNFDRFDPNMASNPAERGAVFFAPRAETANSYAESLKSVGEAGDRVYRTTVEPGRTGVLDIAKLAETDPAFNAQARDIYTKSGGHPQLFDDHLEGFMARRAGDREVAAQMKDLGYLPNPADESRMNFGFGHIGAAIERAKAQGLDTAIIRGLAEHGGDDQLIALTPGRVRSYYDPDHVLYSGGPAGAAPVAVATSTTGEQTMQEPSPVPQASGGNPFRKYVPEAAPTPGAEAPTTAGNPFSKYAQAPADDGRAGGALNAAARGAVNGVPIVGPALLGGIDRADAAVRALTNDSKYSDEVAKADAYGARMKEEHPTATTAGEIAGAVASTVPLVVAAPAAFGAGAAPLTIRAGASALTNAAIGGADAGVRSGGDLDAVKKGALIGGLAGTLAPVAGAVAGKAAEAVASKISPAAAVPGVEELKAAARAAYDRADQAGVQIAAPSFQAAIHDIGQSIRAAGLDKTIHPKATAALARLEEAAGSAPTLKDVDLLRRVAKSAAGSIEPDEKRIGSILVDKIDDFMGRLKPGDLVSGDAGAATEAMTEARTLWGRARRAELIDNAVTAAEDRAASTGSGGNTENAIRQNIRGILSSPKKRAGFSGEEIDAMREVVRGGTVQNLARRLGKLAPEGLIGMMEIGAGMAHPSIETAAIPAVGFLAKKYAEHAADAGVRRLGDLVRSGGQIPVSPLALPARQATEPLAVNIFGGVPRVASQRQ